MSQSGWQGAGYYCLTVEFYNDEACEDLDVTWSNFCMYQHEDSSFCNNYAIHYYFTFHGENENCNGACPQDPVD